MEPGCADGEGNHASLGDGGADPPAGHPHLTPCTREEGRSSPVSVQQLQRSSMVALHTMVIVPRRREPAPSFAILWNLSPDI